MYVDGVVLLVFYIMLVIALMLSLYNLSEILDLKTRLNRRPTVRKEFKPKEPIKVSRPKGYWDQK